MKKILLGLGSLVSVIAPVAAVVSCGTKAAPAQTPAPAAQPAAQTQNTDVDGTNADGANAAGDNTNGAAEQKEAPANLAATAATPTINHNPVAEPATYPVNLNGQTVDVSTFGKVWLVKHKTQDDTYELKFSGTSYNDILDKILDHYKNEEFNKGDGLLRHNKGSDRWAIWDIPTPDGNTVAKLGELGITLTDDQMRHAMQYCFDSADDAIAYVRGLSNDLKAKIFNTVV